MERGNTRARDAAPPRYVRLVLPCIFAGTIALRLRALGVPLERDEGEYAYMGQLILHGEVPYLAAQNMKLPGVYYAYAAILELFGQTGFAIHTALLGITLASLALVFLVGRRLFDAVTGLVAAVVYAMLTLDPSMLGFTANAEHFVMLPVLAGVLVLSWLEPEHRARRRRALVTMAGALLGIAVVMKQQAAAFVAFGSVYVLLDAAWRRRTIASAAFDAASFLAAALLPYGVVCLAMYRDGAFGPFWFWTVTYAREYVGVVPLADGMSALRGEAIELADAVPGAWLLAGTGLAALVWDGTSRRQAWFLALFAVASFAAVTPGLRFTSHYFILLVPAASLLAGVAVSALGRIAAERRAPRTATAIIVGLPLVATLTWLVHARAFLFEESPPEIARSIYGSNPFPEAIAIADYLRAHTDESEHIAVIGSEPEIYFYAHRHAATSYLYTYPMMEPQPFARSMQEDMIAQLERERPLYIVFVNVDTSWLPWADSSRQLIEWTERTVNDAYDAVGIADIYTDHDTVYRWDDAARGPASTRGSFVAVFRRRV